jgi:hypothetical protein
MQDRERAEDQVVALLAAARRRDRAPASLRAQIERDRTQARARRSPAALPGLLGRRVFAGGLAAAVSAAVLIIALAVPSGSSVLPSISEATALALQGPTAKAPSASGSLLREKVGAVSFPNWGPLLNYTAVGQRTTQLRGHRAVVVYYRRAGETVAYVIFASGTHWPAGTSLHKVGKLDVGSLTVSGNAVVTWRQGHDTCVLVSKQLSTDELLTLAGWAQHHGQLGADRDGDWLA